MTFFLEDTMTHEHLQLVLPESSPYQCDLDFILIEDGGRFCWEGAGDYEGDHCGFESHRRIEDAAADALFRLSIADGEDVATATLAVFAVGLPIDHLDLEYIDHP